MPVGLGQPCGDKRCFPGLECHPFLGSGSLCVVSTQDHLPYIFIVSASISVLCSCFLLGSYIYFPPLREFPNNFHFYRALCDFGFATQFIATQAFTLTEYPSTTPPGKLTGCSAIAFFTQFFAFGSLGWFFVFSWNYWVSVSNPFSRPTLRIWQYHLGVWAIAAATGLIASRVSAYRSDLHVCWTTDSKLDSFNPFDVFLFQIWVVFAWLASALIYVVCKIKLKGGGLDRTLLNRKTTLVAGSLSLSVFALFWFCTGLLFGVHEVAFDDTTTHSALTRQLFAAVLPLSGGLNFLVWGISSRQKVAQYLRQAGEEVYQFAEAEGSDDISQSLREEFIRCTTSGIRRSASAGAGDSNTKRPATRPAASSLAGLARVISFQLDLLNGQLELPYWRFVLKKARKKTDSLTYCPRVFRCLGLDRATHVEFRVYEPKRFSRLRTDVYGIADSTYKEMFGGGVKKMAKGFSEGGRSGSFFYFTQSRQLIVKTLTRSEHRLLLSMVKPYADHMVDNCIWRFQGQHSSNSLITKVYGSYSIKMYGHVQYFVVIDNVLWSPQHSLDIQQRYDLKGSWVDRNAQSSAAVLKDNDLKSSLALSRQLCRKVFWQALRDVSFLSRHNIMDYSLLLGVHYCREARGGRDHCSGGPDRGSDEEDEDEEDEGDRSDEDGDMESDRSVSASFKSNPPRLRMHGNSPSLVGVPSLNSTSSVNSSELAPHRPPTSVFHHDHHHHSNNRASPSWAVGPPPLVVGLDGILPPSNNNSNNNSSTNNSSSNSSGDLPPAVIHLGGGNSPTGRGRSASGANASSSSAYPSTRSREPSVAGRLAPGSSTGGGGGSGSGAGSGGGEMRSRSGSRMGASEGNGGPVLGGGDQAEDPRFQGFHQQFYGGMSSEAIVGPGIYFMGVIDIFQEWNMSKRSERAFKRFCRFQDAAGISSLPPREYGVRFIMMLCKRMKLRLSSLTEDDEAKGSEVRFGIVRGRFGNGGVGATKEYLVRLEYGRQGDCLVLENWESEKDLLRGISSSAMSPPPGSSSSSSSSSPIKSEGGNGNAPSSPLLVTATSREKSSRQKIRNVFNLQMIRDFEATHKSYWKELESRQRRKLLRGLGSISISGK